MNKNSIPGDTSAFNPGGVRLGTPAVTTRGMQQVDMLQIAAFLHEALAITSSVTSKLSVVAPALTSVKGPGKGLKEFTELAGQEERLTRLKEDVRVFARRFPVPGLL